MAIPSSATIKGLFARSGNRCAFSDCFVPLVEESNTVSGEVCHIKARSVGGPRYDKKQTEKERNGAENLILLCARHHKIVDDDAGIYTEQVLHAMKKERESIGDISMTATIEKRAELLRDKLIINVQGALSVSEIHAQHVTIKSAGRVRTKISPPVDVVGGSSSHRTYLKYLIARYQEFAKEQKGREFKFAVIYKSIQREFKADWDWIPLSQFHEAVDFLQGKIDRTIIGRQQKKRGSTSYEDFEGYSMNRR